MSGTTARVSLDKPENGVGLAGRTIEEIAARRAVAGVAEEIILDGGSPEQADAVSAALRHHLLGDRDKARRALTSAFLNETADQILAQFDEGARDR